jgi:hypothetical protein
LRFNNVDWVNWFFEYSVSSNKLDFVTNKSYNLSITDSSWRSSVFFDTHPHFMNFVWISTDNFISTICPSWCRHNFWAYNSTTWKLWIIDNGIWTPFMGYSGWYQSWAWWQYITYKLFVK